MMPYEEYLAHLVNVTSRSHYICLIPGRQVTSNMRQQIDVQVQKHEDRLGRVYNFFLKQGFDDADYGAFAFVKDYLFGLTTTRGTAGEALSRLSGALDRVDLVAVQIGTLGARFLVSINGDRLSPASAREVADSLNEIGKALLQLQGEWKVKVAGLKIGKGIGMDVTGSAVFAFSTPETLAQSRSVLDQLELGTTLTDRLKKGLKSSLLNPLLFGQKGSINVSKLVCRLYDRSMEVPGFWRSLTAKVGVVDRFYFGFTPDDLLPSLQ